MDPAAARREALLRFGSRDAARELNREARGVPVLEDFIQDVRHGTRLLGRNPLFAVTAALSLAIGIGADITVFTVANGFLFRKPAGVADAGRLVETSRTREGDFGISEISHANYLDMRERVTTLEDLFEYKLMAEPMSLASPEGAGAVFGNTVSTNYFAGLGVTAAAGRLFDLGDGGPAEAKPVAVLSHRFWTRRFKNDPGIIGQTLQLNGQPFTVIGVAAEAFQGTSMVVTDIWIPFGVMPFDKELINRREYGWALVAGRLKPGVSVSAAAAEMDTIGRVLAAAYPEANRGTGLRAGTLSMMPASLIVPVGGLFTLLLGFVSLVLIIACANVAGVLLARAAARRREIAVRLAIGAGRARLIRQLLTETMLLFVLGGAAGLLLSRGMTALVMSVIPRIAPVPIDLSLELDGRVIVFTIGLSLIASVLCGLAPAFQASKADVTSALKDDSQGSPLRLRLRNAFVVAQVALAIVLVIAAGMFVRAVQRAGSIDPGFDARGVELASLNLSIAGYDNTTGPLFARNLLERVRALPSVSAAGIAATLPTTGSTMRFGELTIPGVQPPDGRPFLEADWNLVEPGYFAAMRIPLAAGRDINAGDVAGRQIVGIVSEEGARRFWPGQDAVGKTLLLHSSQGVPNPNPPKTVIVVGVASDVWSPRGGSARPMLYLPLQQQFGKLDVTLIARTTRGQRITGEIRALVASMDPNLPILTAQTLEEAAAAGLVSQRIAASVTGTLGIVGLLLAAIGVYGVTAYAVARRTREIGIRIALGAQRGDVVNMVLRQGMSLVAIGSVIGLVLSAIIGFGLKRALFGLPPIEPLTFTGTAMLFAAIGLLACYLPVRRATRINAMDALRHD